MRTAVLWVISGLSACISIGLLSAPYILQKRAVPEKPVALAATSSRPVLPPQTADVPPAPAAKRSWLASIEGSKLDASLLKFRLLQTAFSNAKNEKDRLALTNSILELVPQLAEDLNSTIQSKLGELELEIGQLRAKRAEADTGSLAAGPATFKTQATPASVPAGFVLLPPREKESDWVDIISKIGGVLTAALSAFIAGWVSLKGLALSEVKQYFEMEQAKLRPAAPNTSNVANLRPPYPGQLPEFLSKNDRP